MLFSDVCTHIDLTDLAYKSSLDTDTGSSIPNTVSLKIRSDFYLINSRDSEMDPFQKLVERDLVSLVKTISHKSISNLNSKEKVSLKELQNDPSIIIKNADKGGAVVVMQASAYKEEALRQLSDRDTYLVLKGDPTDAFKKELSSLLDKGVSAGILSTKDKEMLIPEFPFMPIFHHLPKVHKGFSPLTGRPIVAGIGSLNERLGQWVDQQLQPLVTELPSYLRDTKQLLAKLETIEWHDEYCWISCGDVSSLYSS